MFTIEKAVGPNVKFWMFFEDKKAANPDLIGSDGKPLETDFITSTVLCSTYVHMRKIIEKRPETLEFRNKWNNEITAADLEVFIEWVVENYQNQNKGLFPYTDIFAAIALALKPFYLTDENVKTYIDNLARSANLMKFVAEEIINEQTQQGT